MSDAKIENPVRTPKKPVLASDTAKVKVMYETAVGIDVHRDTFVCCLQSCQKNNDSAQLIEIFEEFGTKPSDVEQLIQWVKESHVEAIVFESTGVYWLKLYNALTDLLPDVKVILINAKQTAARHGRKSDKKDAQRLATELRIGALRGSFVPNKQIQDRRIVSRATFTLTKQKTSIKNRIHKILQQMGCSFCQVFSRLSSQSAQKVLHAIVDGYRGEELFQFIQDNCSRVHASDEEIFEAVSAGIDDFPLAMKELKSLLKQLDDTERLIQEKHCLIIESFNDREKKVFNDLMKIPGVKMKTAITFLSEVGADLSAFDNVSKFASWAGLCPGQEVSAGKSYSRHCAKGNRYLKNGLIEAAQAVAKSKNTVLRETFEVLKARRGYKRAIVALAHKILRIMFAVVRDDCPYHEDRVAATMEDLLTGKACSSIVELTDFGYADGLRIVGQACLDKAASLNQQEALMFADYRNVISKKIFYDGYLHQMLNDCNLPQSPFAQRVSVTPQALPISFKTEYYDDNWWKETSLDDL